MADSDVDVDSIIDRLLEVRGSRPGKQVQLLETEIRHLCTKAREIFISQPILLELEAPIKVGPRRAAPRRRLTPQICGDIHGQYYDLLRLFEYGGFPPEANYLFLGDYVDRGKQSLETICLLLAYKIKYPENFFVLRGNHECASINRIYGFYDECKRRYNIKLWKTFTDCFNCLPIAAIIDEKIFTMHGGLSPDLNSMEQIRRVMRPTDVSAPAAARPADAPDPRLRPAVRPAVVGPGQGHYRVERERPRRVVYLWARRRVALPAEARHGPHLPRAPGRRGRLRVLLQAPARHALLGAQLLRRV